MFTEYDIAGVISRTGLRANGRDWRDLMTKNQFSAANQGPEFAKILMRLFAQIETSARKSKQMPEDPEKMHPLSTTLKGRYFEHCVANEREPQSLHSPFRLQRGRVRLHLFLAGSRGV
jgi:hypothetical protein